MRECKNATAFARQHGIHKRTARRVQKSLVTKVERDAAVQNAVRSAVAFLRTTKRARTGRFRSVVRVEEIVAHLESQHASLQIDPSWIPKRATLFTVVRKLDNKSEIDRKREKKFLPNSQPSQEQYKNFIVSARCQGWG